MKDPFSAVYSGLWDLAERCDLLTSQVRMQNRIRFDTSSRNPMKDRVSDADFPELMLMSLSTDPQMWNTSGTSKVVKQYAWVATTSDARINRYLNPLEWAIFVAMHGWSDTLAELTWKTRSYVKSCQFVNASESLFGPLIAKQSPPGWSALWTCQVDMHFSINDILDERKA